MKNDEVYLRHILDAISAVEEYLADLDESGFRESRMVQDAVIRQLQIMGEATKRVSPAVRDAHPQVPWQDVAGMRDKLAHHYFGVDLETVWLTATQDLKPLKVSVREILEHL